MILAGLLEKFGGCRKRHVTLLRNFATLCPLETVSSNPEYLQPATVTKPATTLNSRTASGAVVDAY